MAKVESYAGSAYPESPRALEWEGQRYLVEAILERRREPHGVGFLVRCKPDLGTSSAAIFDLFYHFEEEQWEIQHERSLTVKRSSS